MKELILAASTIALIVVIAFIADNFNADIDLNKISYASEVTSFNQPIMPE